MSWPAGQGLFELGDFALQKGGMLPGAKMAWHSHGTLSPSRDNVILVPTAFCGHGSDAGWQVGPDSILDPDHWFIVIADMFGNGVSTSPSNNPAYPRLLAMADNVRAQRQLLERHFGISRLACVYGWSMGGQQAYHWGALYPDTVQRIIVSCGSARTAPHNKVYLASLLAILEAAPEYVGEGRFNGHPKAALRALGRTIAGWALSQEFYRDHLYREPFAVNSLEAYLETIWDPRFAGMNPADIHAHITTWYHSDISDNDLYGGDFQAALGAITARALLMPGRSDLYFRVADNERELAHLRHGKLTVIPSDWGHTAGVPLRNPVDRAFVREQVRAWLAE